MAAILRAFLTFGKSPYPAIILVVKLINNRQHIKLFLLLKHVLDQWANSETHTNMYNPANQH